MNSDNNEIISQDFVAAESRLLNAFNNIIDLVNYRSDKCSNRVLYTTLANGEEEENQLTFNGLANNAKIIAGILQQDLRFGDRALLLFPAGLDFINAFYGCLYSGIIAVPLAIPRRYREDLTQIVNVIKNSEALAIISTTAILKDLKLPEDLNFIKIINIDEINSGLDKIWKQPKVKKNDIAFLQYTSGSTGSPNGVIVTHGNLLHNQQQILKSFCTSPQSVLISWLPHYHDMGLIGNIIHPLYVGFHAILMPPLAFLQKPYRWLKAISKYKATISGGPNFAYDLCVERITHEQKESLKLESWRVAFNGAERVRADTINKFSEVFEGNGFKKQSFFPTYGMAENTLFASGGDPDSKPVILAVNRKNLENNKIIIKEPGAQQDIQLLVSSGRSSEDQMVIAVDPIQKEICKDLFVGEIWIKSSSVTKGYWKNSLKTKDCYEGYLKDGSGPFLQTGDLGFLKDGEIFITGRIKDLIIIRGRNIYPEELEIVAQKVDPILRNGCGAAFSIDDNNEDRIVLVQEIDRSGIRSLNENQIFNLIVENIAKYFDLQIFKIILIKPFTLPKTTSGKVRRQETKKLLLNGRINPIAHWDANASPPLACVNSYKKITNAIEVI